MFYLLRCMTSTISISNRFKTVSCDTLLSIFSPQNLLFRPAACPSSGQRVPVPESPPRRRWRKRTGPGGRRPEPTCLAKCPTQTAAGTLRSTATAERSSEKCPFPYGDPENPELPGAFSSTHWDACSKRPKSGLPYPSKLRTSCAMLGVLP